MALSLEIQVYLDAIVIVMLIRDWFVPSQASIYIGGAKMPTMCILSQNEAWPKKE